MHGIADGTKTPVTNNITVCEDRVSNSWDHNAMKLVNVSKQGDLWEIGWLTFDMIYNLDPITYSCWSGYKEVVLGIEYYVSQLYVSAVMNNIVFNFGDMFDSIRNTILYFTYDARGDYKIPYDAGYGLGHAIYGALKPPKEKKPDHPY